MAKRKKIDRLSRILLVIIGILVLLIVFFSIRTYSHYQALRSHRAYFRQPDAEIRPWMTINAVSRRFNISTDTLLKKLFINFTTTTNRQTIQSFCDNNNLNCTQVVMRLNSQRGR